jgi:phosphate starvation-inducible protein PhoH and related proteins
VVGKIEGIAFVYFNERDVVRHNLVQQIIKAYDEFAGSPARSVPAASEPANNPKPANTDVNR